MTPAKMYAASALAVLLAAAGCEARHAAASVEAKTSALIVDGARNGGTAGFSWIPPMTTTAPSFTTLDQSGVANGLTVRIDRLYADLSIDPSPKATFTGSAISMVTGASSASFPGVTGPFYGVNWAPAATVAAGQNYRVSVQALTNPARVLGVADVQVVANATAAGQVDRTKFTPLVAGATLAIVFRLEAKDSDGDTLNDWRDDCPVTKNINQLDSDADGVGDACQCLGMANGTPCRTACRTGQTCQAGACSGGSQASNGTTCSTGNLCKQSETCTSGVCGGGSNRANASTCSTGNPCKQNETCTTGVCGGGGARGNGTTCSTGNPCKQSETCTSGVCGGGSNRTNGTTCSTGSVCKQSETCTSGVCGGGSNRTDGTPCGDRNLCTQTDTCQAGLCAGGGAVVCPAADACHPGGSCDRTRGVCPAVRPDGTSCTDNNACTLTDACRGGTCTGTPKVCAPIDTCHAAGTCAPATGVCSVPPPLPAGTCSRNPYEYDGAGRLVRDGDATLVYDGNDRLKQLTPAAVTNPTTTAGRPAVPMKYTYGYDGLRTSAVTNAGLANQTIDYWFNEDYSERSDGRRDHYLRVGDRVVARMSYRPPAGAGVMVPPRAIEDSSSRPGGGSGPWGAPPLVALAMGLALLAALAVRARSALRRRAAAVLAVAVLATVPSCQTFESRSAAVVWTRSQELYFHQGVAAGPTLLTDNTGAVYEERRYEPFGGTIDAFRTVGGTGTVDFARDPRNVLNKETDPATQWSFHGARWMAPQTARWLSPDPAVKGPDANHMGTPWDLNPYQYGRQAPTIYWDPNGADVYMVIYTNHPSDDSFARAAATRVREIEELPTFNPQKDHVYTASVLDLGKLGETVQGWKSNAMLNRFGKTVSLDVFGHNGLSDGPKGDLPTSKPFSLGDSASDRQQMSTAGWKALDFNWDTKRSLAAFHGCHSLGFAKKFSQLQPGVHAVGGFDTSSFPSTSPATRTSRKIGGSNELYFVGSAVEQRFVEKLGLVEASASPMSVIDRDAPPGAPPTQVIGNPNPPPADQP